MINTMATAANNTGKIDNLASYGILTRNMVAHTRQAECTVVVLGVQRGGTSMVAEMLSTLGIYMGEASSPTYEDRDFSSHLHKYEQEIAAKGEASAKTIQPLLSVADKRNNMHAVWGFKFPDVICPELYSNLRNPVFISVHRDLIGICARLQKSSQADIAHSLPTIMALQERQNNFLLTMPYPCLALSYEKALLNPEACVDNIIEFLGITITAAQRAQAIKNIRPSPETYLNQTQWVRVIGNLDRVKGGLIRGWVADVETPDRELTVYAVIDGVHLLQNTSYWPRLDAKEYLATLSSSPSHKNIGFRISVPAELRDGKPHHITIRVESADEYRVGGSGKEYIIT